MLIRTLFVVTLLPIAAIGAEENQERRQTPLEKTLLQIAKEYLKYSRVDESTRVAPTLCRPPQIIAAPVVSRSTDEQTHGRKLYFLYAKMREQYIHISADATKSETNPIGQVLVKESYKAREVNAADGGHSVVIDHKHYQVGERDALFVMYKIDPKSPDTDDGWVYGTVAGDGTSVTASGKIKSCMECHKAASHERLFGMSDLKQRTDSK